MKSILKSTLFVATVLLLALIVFPVTAQVKRIVADNCGFAGLSCTGGDTFSNRILPWGYLAITATLSIIAFIAIVYLTYAGVQYITSGGDTEKANRAKMQIVYAVIGLIVAITARVIASAVAIGLVTPNAGAAIIITIINQFIIMAQILIPIAAVIYLMYAGYKYINSQGNTESAEAAKKQIIYAILGLIVSILAGVIVNAVLLRNTSELVINIYSIVNAVLTLAGLAAAIYVVLAGVMYFTSLGDSEKTQRAKMQLIYAAVGIIVILLSAVIVNFFGTSF